MGDEPAARAFFEREFIPYALVSSLSGDTGCNEFGGNYILDGDQLTFNNIVFTLVLCPDLQMAQEDAVQRVLTETATFNIEGDTLTIVNNDTVLVFEAGR